MKKESKRITAMLNAPEYELLQNMFVSESDGAMVSSFITEMGNIIKIELDGLKVFSQADIDELLKALEGRELSFNTVQPQHSFLYILKDYYKFHAKTAVNHDLLKKVNGLSNLQVVVLARFLLTFSSTGNADQARHFFLRDEAEDVKIITKVIRVTSNVDLDSKMARLDSILETLDAGDSGARMVIIDKRKKGEINDENEPADKDDPAHVCCSDHEFTGSGDPISGGIDGDVAEQSEP